MRLKIRAVNKITRERREIELPVPVDEIQQYEDWESELTLRNELTELGRIVNAPVSYAVSNYKDTIFERLPSIPTTINGLNMFLNWWNSVGIETKLIYADARNYAERFYWHQYTRLATMKECDWIPYHFEDEEGGAYIDLIERVGKYYFPDEPEEKWKELGESALVNGWGFWCEYTECWIDFGDRGDFE